MEKGIDVAGKVKKRQGALRRARSPNESPHGAGSPEKHKSGKKEDWTRSEKSYRVPERSLHEQVLRPSERWQERRPNYRWGLGKKPKRPRGARALRFDERQREGL